MERVVLNALTKELQLRRVTLAPARDSSSSVRDEVAVSGVTVSNKSKETCELHREFPSNCLTFYLLPHGLGCGLGRGRGVALGGVGVGVTVGVGVGGGKSVGVGVGLGGTVAVAVGVGVGEAPPTAARISTRPQP